MASRLLTLTRDYPECWAYMPYVLERAANFCLKYDTDTKPGQLVKLIQEHFVVEPERQTVRAIVGLKDDRLVAHCVVSVDQWCGNHFLTIVQFESDEPLPRQVLRDGLDQIAWWGKSKGASVMRLLALQEDQHGPARVRAFRWLYGFQPVRMVLDKSLEG